MKLKFLITIVIVSITVLDCYSQKEITKNKTFELSGVMTDNYSEYLYLNYGNIIDSAFVKNKIFSFKGKVDYPTEAVLHTKNEVSQSSFYLENSKMTINVSVKNSATTINSIKGNKTALIISDLQSYFQEMESDPDFTLKLYKKLDTIITQNPRNQFSGMILSDIILDPIFNFQQANNLYNKLDLTTQKQEEIESIKASLLKMKSLYIGTTLKDFEFVDNKGKLINTSEIEKSILLVDFWASWCVPYRQTNPELVRIYNNYNDKGFEIYGVSLDVKKESWFKAIEDDNLNWTNTFAEGGFENEIIRSLQIQYLPSNFLIDHEGKILAINIRPIDLEKILNEKLEK